MTAPGTPLRTLASLFAPVESETPAGGRTVAWEPIGDLWLAVEPPTRRLTGGEDQPPDVRARSRAESRMDPRVATGLRVEMRGAAWRVVHVDAETPRPGRMTLTLERDET